MTCEAEKQTYIDTILFEILQCAKFSSNQWELNHDDYYKYYIGIPCDTLPNLNKKQ